MFRTRILSLNAIKRSGRCLAKDLRKVSQFEQRRCSSSTNESQKQKGTWETISKSWRETKVQWYPLPIGAGLAWLVAYQSYKYYKKNQEEFGITLEEGSPYWLRLYVNLPWKFLSRQWGAMHSVELPAFLRGPLYRLYSSIFGCNLEEMANPDLESYPNLGEFFYRPLKQGARTIDSKADLISPSDGRVLHFGKIVGDKVEQIKGVTYSLQNLLGTGYEPNKEEKTQEAKSIWRFFYPSSKQNTTKKGLFFAVIYLAPGDYHRFHSPADWSLQKLRHFSGELFSVSPFMVKALKDLFVLNERVVLLGKWKHGFFSMIPVGATNVGSIRINVEPELVTNQPGQLVTHPLGTFKEVAYHSDAGVNSGLSLARGEELGGFRLGSTVVLVFEAPTDFKFNLEQGQRVYTGQSLC